MGWSWHLRAFFGCVVALSSTAIAVKLLSAGDELRAPHGRFALGVLLFQDLAVVPMMIILPALASARANAMGLVTASDIARRPALRTSCDLSPEPPGAASAAAGHALY